MSVQRSVSLLLCFVLCALPTLCLGIDGRNGADSEVSSFARCETELPPSPQEQISCSILIAGGSTASLAAALSAANVTAAAANATTLPVCFLEMTDMPGGQLTAEGVSAIDYGPWNHDSKNLPQSFASLKAATEAVDSDCWVSYHCFLPTWAQDAWINPQLSAAVASGALRVFLRTVVKEVRTGPSSASGGSPSQVIEEVLAIQRSPTVPQMEWAVPLSIAVDDWYSPENSSNFTKQTLRFTADVFIDATDFADVLVNSGANFTQGYEYPDETSTQCDPTCGQAATLVFFMEYATQPNQTYASTVPFGSDAGIPFPEAAWSEAVRWNESWTYRRGAKPSTAPGTMTSVNPGDVTQQNWVNDVDNAYVLLPMLPNNESFPIQRPWFGGVNKTTLRLLEDRSFGTFHFLLNTSTGRAIADYLQLAPNASGTPTGFAKVPYLRDTRRGFGIDGFRFTYASEYFYNVSDPYIGEQFFDTVALGDYLYADIHRPTFCALPSYTLNASVKPFQIPFRALTVQHVDNLLVAGRTMSQTFHANAATRLHPVEWSTGVAAGVAAALMVQRGWRTSRDVLQHVTTLQDSLREIGQPLTWTPPHNGTLPPLPVGFACLEGFNRPEGDRRRNNITDGDDVHYNEGASTAWCVSAPRIPAVMYPSSSCNGTCAPLPSNVWLAHNATWRLEQNATACLVTAAWAPSYLKKSIASSSVLPPAMLQPASACRCIPGFLDVVEEHYVCTLPASD